MRKSSPQPSQPGTPTSFQVIFALITHEEDSVNQPQAESANIKNRYYFASGPNIFSSLL